MKYHPLKLVFCNALLVVILASQPASARLHSPQTVITNCTQSDLVNAVAAGGSIIFNCGPGPVTIPITSYIPVAGAVTIDGGGQITLDGGGRSSFFQIFATAALTLANLTITNGNDTGIGVHPLENFGTLILNNTVIQGNHSVGAGAGINNAGTLTITGSTIQANVAVQKGAGIYSTNGNLTITRSTIRGNTISGPPGGGGGGIHLGGGSLTLVDSTVEANTGFDGGGIFTDQRTNAAFTNVTLDTNMAAYGGGAEIDGALTATNATITGNTASQDGGGLWLLFGTAALNNVTISGNTAQNGNAINTNGGSATLSNTILDSAGNTSNCNAGATLTSNGYNLSSDASCPLNGTGDRTGIPALLAPLANNGGPTQTQALLAGSPAIDKGNNARCAATDQRGIARPVNGTGAPSAVCDIGAYEYVPIHVYVPLVRR